VGRDALPDPGGRWPRRNERQDPDAIRQETPDFCGCACGLIVLKRLGISPLPTQTALWERGGSTLFSVATLSHVLNEEFSIHSASGVWKGQGIVPAPGRDWPTVFRELGRATDWIAHLRETGARVGHLVVVSHADSESVRLLDPWIGSAYEMSVAEFLDYWNFEAVYLKRGGI
jgi:hypothetical protein